MAPAAILHASSTLSVTSHHQRPKGKTLSFSSCRCYFLITVDEHASHAISLLNWKPKFYSYIAIRVTYRFFLVFPLLLVIYLAASLHWVSTVLVLHSATIAYICLASLHLTLNVRVKPAMQPRNVYCTKRNTLRAHPNWICSLFLHILVHKAPVFGSCSHWWWILVSVLTLEHSTATHRRTMFTTYQFGTKLSTSTDCLVFVATKPAATTFILLHRLHKHFYIMCICIWPGYNNIWNGEYNA